ncbi:unnamed protein product [Ectocarpus sp. 6 AP-2014]
MERNEVVFVLGGPGSGKGTHCARIAAEFGYTHLSTGDLLREEQKKESELATKIAECIRDGQLVPSSTMVALLKEAILKGDSKRFLLDGFPRSKDNLETWFDAFSDEEIQVSFTLFLHCPKEELKKRLLERGETSGRADDNVETVLKRFDTFEKESLPVVEELRRLGMVRKVSTVPARELVAHRVSRYFKGCRLVDPVERTLALIKPDATGNTGEILNRVEQEGFVVVGKIEGRVWSQQDAATFYSEHSGKAFFDTLVDFMSSGPIVQLCLEKVGAIKAWRELAGPTNSTDAKTLEPSSIRALYGTCGTKNAVHGSDSFASALREINFCFDQAAEVAAVVAPAEETAPAGGAEQNINGRDGGVDGGYNEDGFAKEEKTLALLKPGISELHSDDILSVLAYRGFIVRKTATRVMEESEARSFYQEYSSETWFKDACTSMAERGETTAICISGVKGVASLQALAGPGDPKEAKERAPRSLRATYGEDTVNNAVHASASVESATRDLNFWFPESVREVSSGGSPAPTSTGARGDPKYDEMMTYMQEEVDPVISPLLQRVLKARPHDVASFAAQALHQLALTGPSTGTADAS